MQKFVWENSEAPSDWQKSKPAPWEPAVTNLALGKTLKDQLLLGHDAASGETATITPSHLSTHMHVLGASGVGKSFFLEGMIKTLILQGKGVCLIDPHGDLYERVLDFCTWLHVRYPKQRIVERVIPFNVAERQHIFGFNPVARNARVMTYQVVALMEAIRKAWGQDSFDQTPRLARWLFNAAYALIEADLTLVQSKHLLDPKPNQYRDGIVQRLKSPDIKAEWEYLSAVRDKERNEFTESSFNRLRPFVMNEVISAIIGRQRRTVNFPSVLDGQKILLINLARQNTISEDYQQMLGTLLVNELLTAAFARPRGQRAPFYCFIDEFSRFVTKDICEILDGGRKFGLHLILAHQHLNQLKQKDPEVYYSTLTNARLKSVFGGLAEEDLDLMSKELYTGELDPEQVKQEIWHTVFEPVETTRIIETQTNSESSGSSSGYITHSSFADSTMYIPGSGLFSVPEQVGNTRTEGYGRGDSDGHQNASSYGSSRAVVPWYEFHKTSELSSREFRSLEEQLYLKKAQLKRQPNQHHAFLMPGQSVQILKTGTLIDHGEEITDRHREQFKDEAYANAGYFDSPETILQEQHALEVRLLTDARSTVVIESGPVIDAEFVEEPAPSSKRKPRTKPQKPKPNIYDTILPLPQKDRDQQE